jgi:hypothetical protein
VIVHTFVAAELSFGTTATLSLSGLASFTAGTLTFNLYGIDSLDGNGPFGGGPDPFTVTGPGLSYTTNIANFPGNTQAFPNGGTNPPDTGATAIGTLGYATCCGGPGDSIYSITLNFMSAPTTSLVLSFTDGSNEGNANEFYGIDNVVVTTNGVPVPGPIAGAGPPGLIAVCGGLIALARRRRKFVA